VCERLSGSGIGGIYEKREAQALRVDLIGAAANLTSSENRQIVSFWLKDFGRNVSLRIIETRVSYNTLSGRQLLRQTDCPMRNETVCPKVFVGNQLF
jgi:hypothetical protein